MTRLSLSLLGTWQVTVDGEPITAFESDKVRALLFFLAVESDRPQRRETLAALFWPERPERNARKNLSQALFNLRQAISDRKARPPFLNITPQTIQFNRDSDFRLDVMAFRELVATCRGHEHDRLATCDPCLQRLKQAVEKYRGDFLTGFSLRESAAFDEWVLLKRERFQRLALETLSSLAEAYEIQGAFVAALPYARRQVELDPWREEGQKQLLRLLARSGRRNEALAQYEKYRQLLWQDLGVEPGAETESLAETIRSGKLGGDVAMRFGPTPRHNLPPQQTPFIGRESELKAIQESVEDPGCRLLTLVGPGGIGKTRLALEAAAGNVDTYEHGVFFVPLAGVDAGAGARELLLAIADALPFALSGEAGPMKQLFQYLQPREMLLVLDNFEHLLAEATLLTELLAAVPRLKLLVTSRETVGLQGEWTYVVSGMEYPDQYVDLQEVQAYGAVQFLVSCIRRIRANFALDASNARQILRICRAVNGMPLGIELAATWTRTLSLAEIAAEIEKSLDLLTTSWPDIPERHRSMRAVFEHSWQLLTPEEQAVLQRLSVFRSGFQRDASRQVAGASLNVLSLFVEKSLLVRTRAGRFEIHELLRQFLAEKLREAEDEKRKTQNRHSRYFAQFMVARERELNNHQDYEAFRAIEADIDNIRSAWRWAVKQRLVDTIDKYLLALNIFYGIKGWYQEAVDAFGGARNAFSGNESRDHERALLGKLLLLEGDNTISLGQLDRGRALLQESLHILRQLNVPRYMAIAYNLLGSSAVTLRQAEEAKQHYLQALALFEAIGERRDVEFAYSGLGWAALHLGHVEEAVRYLHQGLAVLQEGGSDRGLAVILGELGVAAHRLGRYREARRHFLEAVVIGQKLGWLHNVSYLTICLADVERDIGAYEEAAVHYQESLTLSRSLPHPAVVEIARALGMLAYVSVLQDEPVAANSYLREVEALYHREADEGIMGWYHFVRGELALAERQYLRAHNAFRQSLMLFQERVELTEFQDNTIGAVRALNGLGKSACGREAYRQARERFHSALQKALAIGAVPEMLDVLVGMASIRLRQGEVDGGLDLLRLVSHHPAVRKDTTQQATKLLTELNTEMPDGLSDAIVVGGEAIPEIKEVVAELLSGQP